MESNRHTLLMNFLLLGLHQACATVQKEYTAILEHSRYLITVHQFNNEPLRLYLACLGGGIHAIDSFIDTNFQKFLHRDMECYRLLAEKKTEPTWNVSRNRWVFKDKGPAQKDKDAEQNDAAASDRSDNDAAATTTSAGGGGGAKPKRYVATADHANPSPKTSTKESPVLLALYGQLSASAKSYQSALCELHGVTPYGWSTEAHHMTFQSIFIRRTTCSRTIL